MIMLAPHGCMLLPKAASRMCPLKTLQGAVVAGLRTQMFAVGLQLHTWTATRHDTARRCTAPYATVPQSHTGSSGSGKRRRRGPRTSASTSWCASCAGPRRTVPLLATVVHVPHGWSASPSTPPVCLASCCRGRLAALDAPSAARSGRATQPPSE